MIFSDKLIQLRKKAGWSQEELAERMKVTRQSVSKWEGAQSVPDIEKIIQLSELFGVSTDYLLKASVKDTGTPGTTDNISINRRVSMEEANAFLSVKNTTSKAIALGTFLCIVSPICLLILGAISEVPAYGLPENVATGTGMIVLLLIVAIAVSLFISSGKRTAIYDFLEKEVFYTESGVEEMVSTLKEQYSKAYTRNNIIGTVLCITALTPLFAGTVFNDQNDLLLIIMLCCSFIIAGIGIVFFIRSGIIWASYEKLLQEGDYSKEKKENPSFEYTIYTAYWLITTAIYSGYSFSTNNWGYSWIIWVVAAVVFPAIVLITNLLNKHK